MYICSVVKIKTKEFMFNTARIGRPSMKTFIVGGRGFQAVARGVLGV
jgi:hypothetical protein